MRAAIAMLVAVTTWVICGPAVAGSLKALQDCVEKAAVQLPACIKDQGKENADPCRTGIMMEVFGCAEKHDAARRHLRDPAHRKVLFDVCIQMHNEGTGQTPQQECDQLYPPIRK